MRQAPSEAHDPRRGSQDAVDSAGYAATQRSSGSGPAGGKDDPDGHDGRAPRLRGVTLRDVAERAQVDVSTASRAMRLSTRTMVRAETVERVLAAAQALGYRVTPVAKDVKAERSMTIGMLLPDLANPLFPPIVRGIEDGLRAQGYALILANTDRDPARERELLDVLLDRRVDGLILATARREYPILTEILDRLPAVLVNRTTETALAPTVASDDHQGIGLAVGHLAGLGHQRIAYVGGTMTASTGAFRYQYFLAWMQSQGLPVDHARIIFADTFTQVDGGRACRTLLDREADFTAIIAGNDLIALGCYAALRERGLRVPDDISVVGYSGLKFCDEFSPPLTSVHVPKYDIGRRAASVLLAHIDNPEAPTGTVLLPTSLQVRASTSPCRTDRR